jgi:hypothetical protein
MALLDMVDEIYREFADSLETPLAREAHRLAFTLKLVPVPDVPWSEVFGHEVTLAAPALFAEAMPHVAAAQVRDAVAAQAFAAIEAFGTDRIEDRQVVATSELRAVLVKVRAARDAALGRVRGPHREVTLDFDVAHDRTLTSIRMERRILAEQSAVPFATYESVSLGKQSVGFPPSLSLAFVDRWDARRRRAMQAMLSSIWLGLQMPDDVVDWEDDLRRGGAWAVSLALATAPRGYDVRRPLEPAAVRALVFESGVLVQMLSRAAWHFRRVRRLGGVLGTKRLVAWATERELHTRKLMANERRAAGHSAREHALIAWAKEVLA